MSLSRLWFRGLPLAATRSRERSERRSGARSLPRGKTDVRINGKTQCPVVERPAATPTGWLPLWMAAHPVSAADAPAGGSGDVGWDAGGFGVGPIEKLTHALLAVDRPLDLVAIAGRKQEVKKRLEWSGRSEGQPADQSAPRASTAPATQSVPPLVAHQPARIDRLRGSGQDSCLPGLPATLLGVADTTEAVRDGPRDASKRHFAACLPVARVFGRGWLSAPRWLALPYFKEFAGLVDYEAFSFPRKALIGGQSWLRDR